MLVLQVYTPWNYLRSGWQCVQWPPKGRPCSSTNQGLLGFHVTSSQHVAHRCGEAANTGVPDQTPAVQPVCVCVCFTSDSHSQENGESREDITNFGVTLFKDNSFKSVQIHTKFTAFDSYWMCLPTDLGKIVLRCVKESWIFPISICGMASLGWHV